MRCGILLFTLLNLASAIFQDEAYQLDYHYALLGQPIEDATFFHQPHANSRASLIYTFTEEGAIGAVNPKDGSLIWRQYLKGSDGDSARKLKSVEGHDFVVSGHGREVNAWSASTGRLLWSHQLVAGKVQDVAVLQNGDVAVLNEQGSHVFGLHGMSGLLQWTYEDYSKDAPIGLTAIANTLYYIGGQKKAASGYRLRVTEIDTTTGQGNEKHNLPSETEVSSLEEVIFIGSSSFPVIAWTDTRHLVTKFVVLGTEAFSTITTDQENKIETIKAHAIRGSAATQQLLVSYQTADKSWADTFTIGNNGRVARGSTIDRAAGKAAYAVVTSGQDIFFTRTTSQAIEVFRAGSPDPSDRFALTSTTALPDVLEPRASILELQSRTGGKNAVRAAVLLSSGDWVLVQNGQITWHRAEALVHPQAVAFVNLAESESLAQALAYEVHTNLVSGYIHRVTRHITALKQLPAFVQASTARLLGSLTGSGSADATTEILTDTFGFRKYIAVATRNGRLIALDTSKLGAVAWNVDLPSTEEDQPVTDISLSTLKPGVLRAEADGQQFYYDVATGQGLPRSAVQIDELQSQAQKVAFETSNGQLVGYRAGQKTAPLWTFTPALGSQIKSLTMRPAVDPVASIGKVLGDRRVLYKYLNSNLLLVTAVQADAGELHMYLLDSASGALLHYAKHESVDTARSIAAVASENWICYSFSGISTKTRSPSQSSQLVITELYESAVPDDRGPLGLLSNYSALTGAGAGVPHILTQSFQIPEEISHMSVSQTAQGITNRLLVTVLANSGNIVGIPRSAFDARRTVGRDPTQPEAMEGLTRYLPYLEFDPRWILNHQRDVLGIDKVIASPAVLESTSLLFGYGFDVFGTRVSPSFSFDRLGKDFNKLQMVSTVIALFAGVLFVAPLVRGKQINTRWQIPS